MAQRLAVRKLRPGMGRSLGSPADNTELSRNRITASRITGARPTALSESRSHQIGWAKAKGMEPARTVSNTRTSRPLLIRLAWLEKRVLGSRG